MKKAAQFNNTLLIVEDDEGLQSQLRWTFDECDLHFANDRESALAAVRRFLPPVVMLDLGLPPDPANVSEGFTALSEILSLAPRTKIIVVTGNDGREHAIRAIGMGAYDFYQKPIDPDVLKIIVHRAFHVCELERENDRLQETQTATPLEGIIAASPEMQRVCRNIEKISTADVTTLLLGESGTGKEVLARAIHNLSDRRNGPFVAINCAAIPENLLESELFGYERGAFTGANKQTLGKFEMASGGTLFLDEIGDLPSALQGKLLRFLQERVIERVGGRKEIPVDVRIICATHRNLRSMIEQGDFREDLYFRLSEITVDIPPVRHRVGDAVLLARNFLSNYAKQHNQKVKGFAKDAITAIEKYPWPGNVRELENKIKRAVVMADEPQITAQDLELDDVSLTQIPINLRQIREEAERNAIVRALSATGNNVAQASELLGVTRPTLYDLMKKLNIKT
jgi:two-component system NtrC family response regulator